MPTTPVGGSPPNPFDDSSVLDLALLYLAAMPPAMCNARAQLAADLYRFPGEERAIRIKGVQPGITDDQIAMFCDVTPEEMRQWDRFEAFKLEQAQRPEPRPRRRMRPAEFPPVPPRDDAFLALAVRGLDAMVPAERKTFLLLIAFINTLPREKLATLAKSVQPHLRDEELADLTGVSERHVQRWFRHSPLKLSKGDYYAAKRAQAQRQWYVPADDDWLSQGKHERMNLERSPGFSQTELPPPAP